MSKRVRNESATTYTVTTTTDTINTATATDAQLCALLGIDLPVSTTLRTFAQTNTVLSAALELSRRVLLEEIQRGISASSSSTIKTYLRSLLRDRNAEVFLCLYLDNQNRLIAQEELFQGTIDGAAVYPRIVVQRVLHHNAAAVIFAHNHPSGVAEPSQADVGITRRLKNALGLIDVRTLDHLVVGDADVVSLAERGLI